MIIDTNDELRPIGVVFACLVGFAAVGCESEPDWRNPGPEARFRSFLQHWFQRERSKAFELIDPVDRERLTSPREALRAELDPSAVPAPDKMLVAGRVDNPYDLNSIEVADGPNGVARGSRVSLALEYHDGRSGRATMVWRKNQWFVDLPKADWSSTPSDGSRDVGMSQDADAGAPEPTDTDARRD